MGTASLVWDGGRATTPHWTMGEPAPGQLAGTPEENLIELATRVCYDSLGVYPEGHEKAGKPRGRSSEKTLANVMKAKHHSVLEHFVTTVVLDIDWSDPVVALATSNLFNNRPGCWIRPSASGLRVTINARAVVEWDAWTERLGADYGEWFKSLHYDTKADWFQGQGIEAFDYGFARDVGDAIKHLFAIRVPHIVRRPEGARDDTVASWFDEPETDAERWVSLYLIGSRGFSHEMVRHRFAVSQRSTRYCDESEGLYERHPLLSAYLSTEERTEDLLSALHAAEDAAREAYGQTIKTLEPWLANVILPEGTPHRKRSARKQARGAARGMLGNCLETRMVFSAPVWGWKHILKMRAADAADAEIRQLAVAALAALKTSRYADRFDGFDVSRASDGIGESLDDPTRSPGRRSATRPQPADAEGAHQDAGEGGRADRG